MTLSGDSQRNALPNSPTTSPGFFTDEAFDRPHPAELLFKIENLKDLVMKSDIPERMVGVISRMLWKAERYHITALTQMVEWYLITRLGKDREARREYMQVVMKYKEPSEEDLAIGG